MPPLSAVARRRFGSREDRLIVACLIIFPLIAFGPSLAGGFLDWDDTTVVSSNLALRPEHWSSFLHYCLRPHDNLFIPLAYSAYELLVASSILFAGVLQPWWFHAASLLLHTANGLILWKLLARLGGDRRAAAAGACVFLLHPLQVESVAWISSLNAVLAGFFTLLSLWYYLCSAQAENAHLRRSYFFSCCVTSAFAMLAKPSACVIPLMAFLLDFLCLSRRLKPAAAKFFILCLVQAPMLFIAHRAGTNGVELRDLPAHRPLVALDALGFYLAKLLAPVYLAIDYGRSPSRVSFGLPMALGGLLLLTIAAIAAIRRFWRREWLLAGTLIFVAALFPVLGLVPFNFQFYSTVADRYAYLAMLGPAIVITGLLRRTAPPCIGDDRPGIPIVFSLAVALAVLMLTSLTLVQSRVWTSDVRLFAQALAVNPDSIAAHQTLGFLAAQAAQEGTENPKRQNQLLALALRYDNAALAVDQENPRAHFNRGNLLLRLGHPDQSVADYAAAAGRFDDEARLQNNWGVAYMELDQNYQALEHFLGSIAADATFADAFANAGTAYLRVGLRDRARGQFSQALSLNPNQPQAIAGLRKIELMDRR
jgi:protein O-mannosyl-transferase